MIIFHCHICGPNEASEGTFDELFKHNGKHVSVQGIPAKVCVRCGDKRITYSNIEQNSERFLTTTQALAPRRALSFHLKKPFAPFSASRWSDAINSGDRIGHCRTTSLPRSGTAVRGSGRRAC
ncbi:YgiT-type zinc finger protein [candidate division KSB1 bacterium]|nr:YgiT-type zinc finger protein [candidate division KSB1 bacterium]